MRRTAWLTVLSLLAGLLSVVTFAVGQVAWALDPLTPVSPPAAVAAPDVIRTVSALGPTVVPGGAITVDTVWGPQGSPYVITSDMSVSAGVSLTLLPGTVVKALGTSSNIYVMGNLLVLGTPDRRVVFTSLRDDSVMGDTNGDGAATAPAPGDWRQIHIGSRSVTTGTDPANIIHYAEFRYGGKSSWPWPDCAMAQVYVGSERRLAIISNSTFAHSQGSHVYYEASGAQNSRFGLYGNTFTRGQGSDCSIRLGSPFAEIVGNTFTDVGLVYSTGNYKSRIWRNYLGGGIYLGVGNLGEPYPREYMDVRYNTILHGFTEYGLVDWTSNWWGYDVNQPLPECMTFAEADAHFPPIRIVGAGECVAGYLTGGFKHNVRPGLSYAPAQNPPTAVREAAAARYGPVDLFSGALTYQETDFGIEDAGKRLSVTRTFRSDKLSGGDAGPGWTSSYVEGLSSDGMGGWVLGLPDGGSIPFASDIAAGYTPASGVFAEFTSDAGGSAITTGEQTTYQFNPAGELTGLLLGDPGHVVDIERSGGKVSKVTGTSGRYFTFTRVDGKVTAATDSTGRGVALSYTDGRLSAVAGVDGKSRRYEYDSAGRLTKVVSPTGVVLMAAEFGADGKVAWLEEAGRGRTTFGYDTANNHSTATLANGDTIIYPYDVFGRLVVETRGSTSTHIVYDGEGRVTAQVAGVPNTAMTGYIPSATASYLDGRNDKILSVDPSGRWELTTYNTQHRPLETKRTDGTTVARTYDANNRLQTLTDPAGKVWQYQFNGRGQVTAQTDPLNRARALTYTTAGDLDTITDETGAVTTFGYDTVGRRTSVTDPLGHQRTATLTAWNATATLTLPRGGLTTVAYDDDRRQTSVTDATGHLTGFEYDTSGRPVAQVNPDTGRVTVEYDAVGRVIKRFNPRGGLTQLAYTAEGWLASHTQPNTAATTFAYDPAGRQYRSTNALGQMTQVVYDPAGRPRDMWNPDGGHTVIGYDTMGRKATLTTPLGNPWRVEYDTVGRPIKWTDPLNYTTLAGYDLAGRLTSTTDQNNVVTTYAYDDVLRTTTVSDALGLVGVEGRNAAGRVSSRTDGTGIVTTYTYDNDGNLSAVTDPAGTWSYEYDLAGRATAQTDPLTHRTSGTYDGLGRLLTVSHPDGTGEAFDYDLNGNLVERTDRVGQHWLATFTALDQPATQADPLDGVTIYTYDTLGRQTSVTDATNVTVHAAYDPMGRLAVTWDALGGSWVTTYDTDGRVTKQTDPSGAGSTFTYDKRALMTQRLWGTTNPVAHSYTYDKVGRPATVSDPYPTTFEYDIRGRVTKQGNYYNQKTTFEYDLAGRTIKRTTPAGHATTFTFDTAGRLKDTTDPLGNKTAYTWDAAGQLATVTLPRGGVYTYGYDTAGRLVTETDPLDAATTFGYDGEGRLTSTAYPSGATTTATYDPAGRVDTVAAGTQTRGYDYDAAGRLTAASTTGSSLGFAYNNRGLLIGATDAFGDTTYQHDYTGRIITISPPSGPATSYTYDTSRGLLASVRGATNIDFTYNAAGQVTNENSVSPSQGSVRRDYDSAGRLFELKGSGHNALITYTADSQIDTVCQPSYFCYASDKLTDYTYDNAGRLANATTTQSGATIASVAYTWDADGNRASVTTNGATPVTATYDLADRLQSTSDGTSYTYDPDGKLTARGATVLTYTPFGEPATDGPVTYGRDALGRMATRTTATTTETFSYDPTHGQLTAARTGTGPVTSLVRRPDGDLLASATTGATTQRASHNAHNDLVALHDDNGAQSGTVRWRATTDPFGVIASTTGTTAVPLGYQGMYTDPATGLVDMGARSYEPATGRFTTPDTIIGDLGLPVSFNRYLYGHADPVNHYDPDGHWPDWLDDALDALGDHFDSWDDEFFGGLNSPGDATTSDIPAVRIAGGLIKGSGEEATGTLRGAETFVRCAKDQRSSCDALGKIFTEEGLNTAWHEFSEPFKACIGGDEVACGRAGAGVVGLVIGAKGLTKPFTAFASASPDLRPATHSFGLPDSADNRVQVGRRSEGSGPGCLKARARHSFAPDTRVLMADGSTKAIDSVEVGDQVTATDPETGHTAAQPVTQLHHNVDEDLTDVTVTELPQPTTRDRSQGNGERSTRGPTTLHTTQHHPFWDASAGAWVDAKDLKPGQSTLTGPNGERQLVTDIRNFAGQAQMRDLTVANTHTYYVIAGETPVLVHNNDPGLIYLGVTGDSCPVADRSEYYNMSTAAKKGKPALTPDEVQNLHDYARGSNAWLEANGPQVVQSTRLLQADMRAAIEAERRTNPGKYPAGWVPGHMPDTGVTGMANPPSWLPSPSRANSVAGGGLSSRIGKTIRGFLVDGVYIT